MRQAANRFIFVTLIAMDATQTLLEILKFTLPSVVVFLTAYFVIKNQSEENLNKIRIEIQRQNQQTITPIKLQAYERLVLLLERISPQQLIATHSHPDQTASSLKFQMIGAIQQEYNYNLSQQIYVSTQSWNLVKVVKEQVIALINAAHNGLAPNATQTDLSKAIIESMISAGQQPTEKAINFLKAEVGLFFG
jgi:hypothetical protein